MSVEQTGSQEQVPVTGPDPGAETPPAPVPDEQTQEGAGRAERLREFWRRHNLGLVGLVLVGGVVFLALLGPLIIQHEPNFQRLAARMVPPLTEVEGELHLLGTDNLGRDMVARLAVGSRASLSVVLLALCMGAALGVFLGLISGYFGGFVDNVIMRLVDAQLSVPVLIFAMLIAAVLGTGFLNTAIALGIAGWPIYARIMRAETLNVRNRDYIQAAEALGAKHARIMVRHILPNILGSMAVVVTLELGRLVLIESALSYIGLGMQPPNASWGAMIRDGQSYIFTAWWLPTLPGILIMMTVLGMNLLGDWMRDRLDPYMR